MTTPDPLSGLVIRICLLERKAFIAWKCSLCILKSPRSTGVPQKAWARSLSLALWALSSVDEMGLCLESWVYRVSNSAKISSLLTFFGGRQKSRPLLNTLLRASFFPLAWFWSASGYLGSVRCLAIIRCFILWRVSDEKVSITSVMSLKNKTKSKGPRIEPWGTPDF